ncbi:carboxylating nicotinate-nucleotide diphosphorylase [Nocardioides sp.]|uniref:carboxylating nicotinate-nucleotide diphosphorylase n=1 Tax=Nocardioides sp. TaxID=35761 RepID=UPI002638D137|nr:carboxylating nicotinate-nucleotide diphosphorylase [Nocardioides sp.]
MKLTETTALPETLLAELAMAGIDVDHLITMIGLAVDEDLPADDSVDVTSEATIAAEARARGDFAVRDAGVVSGLGVAELVFRLVLGDDVTVSGRVPDGTRVAPGDVVMVVEGSTRGLLTAERTALNFASHLSGISTATAAWVEALEGTGTRVQDTRKTMPGMRNLQKYAVRAGGGVNHRMSLVDMALVKDNHVIAAGGVVPAYEAIKRDYPELPIEIEVTTLAELRELLEVGCDRIMLDNMSLEEMTEAVDITAGRAILEASGGLTLERARAVAQTGVDLIAVGALTHSVTVFDIGFDLEDL